MLTPSPPMVNVLLPPMVTGLVALLVSVRPWIAEVLAQRGRQIGSRGTGEIDIVAARRAGRRGDWDKLGETRPVGHAAVPSRRPDRRSNRSERPGPPRRIRPARPSPTRTRQLCDQPRPTPWLLSATDRLLPRQRAFRADLPRTNIRGQQLLHTDSKRWQATTIGTDSQPFCMVSLFHSAVGLLRAYLPLLDTVYTFHSVYPY